MNTHRSALVAPLALCVLASQACQSPRLRPKQTVGPDLRFELPQPGAMIPPVPAIVLGVKGDEETRDDLTIVWTFVLEGTPPYVGISVPLKSAISGDDYVGLDMLRKHGEFTLNVPDTSWIREFDRIDMTASERGDKFAANGLTRLPSKTIEAPGIAEAATKSG